MAKVATTRIHNAPRSIAQKDVKGIYAAFKVKRGSVHLYKGRLCFFFNMGSKFGNRIEKDGFVCGIGEPYQLVPKNTKQPLIASIFTRQKAGDPFDYEGDVNYIVHEDKTHNKMLWG